MGSVNDQEFVLGREHDVYESVAGVDVVGCHVGATPRPLLPADA